MLAEQCFLPIPAVISSLNPPILVCDLIACATGLILFSGSPLAPFCLLGQRFVVLALLRSLLPLPLTVAYAVSSVGVFGILSLSSLLQVFSSLRLSGSSLRSKLPLSRLAFRLAAAALGFLLVDGLLRWGIADLLPLTGAYAVSVLTVYGLILLIVADDSLRAGLGVLSLIDAGRLLYALGRPTAPIWGLWTACDLLIALIAAHFASATIRTARESRNQP